MHDKLKDLIDNHLIDLFEYCNENKIEYIFAAIDQNGNAKKSTNIIETSILKIADDTLKKLLRNK